MRKARAYLDSGIFIAIINGHEESSEACKSIIEAATRGDLEIATSCVTLPEVTKKRSTGLVKPANDEATITGIFQNPVIIYVSVDPRVGILAQQVIWDFGKQTRDSIHIASAIAADADVLYTVDRGLLDISEKSTPRLRVPRIALPEFIGQPELPFGDSAQE